MDSVVNFNFYYYSIYVPTDRDPCIVYSISWDIVFFKKNWILLYLIYIQMNQHWIESK